MRTTSAISESILSRGFGSSIPQNFAVLRGFALALNLWEIHWVHMKMLNERLFYRENV